MTSANQKPQCGGHEIPAAVSELHSDWIRLAWFAFEIESHEQPLIQEAKIYNLIQDPNYSNRNEDRIGRFYEGENVDNVTVVALTSQG